MKINMTQPNMICKASDCLHGFVYRRTDIENIFYVRVSECNSVAKGLRNTNDYNDVHFVSFSDKSGGFQGCIFSPITEFIQVGELSLSIAVYSDW